jgi:hypothetical protein
VQAILDAIERIGALAGAGTVLSAVEVETI